MGETPVERNLRLVQKNKWPITCDIELDIQFGWLRFRERSDHLRGILPRGIDEQVKQPFAFVAPELGRHELFT
jgi:hypothetical protein